MIFSFRYSRLDSRELWFLVLYGCLDRTVQSLTGPSPKTRGHLIVSESILKHQPLFILRYLLVQMFCLYTLPGRPLLNFLLPTPYDVSWFHSSNNLLETLTMWRKPTAEHLVVLYTARSSPVLLPQSCNPIAGFNCCG
jgi:hypothetical protein